MSNKTPAAKSAKTESAPELPKKHRISKLFIAGSLSLIAISCLVFVVWHKDLSPAALRFGSKNLSLDYAVTPAERERGLSGRGQLADNEGMLFQFEQPSLHCFWMKDMKFPIDIVWLNSDMMVIDLRENVSPDSYPAQFCPAQNASYVIEVRAGLTKMAQVDLGDRLQFTELQ